MMKTILMISMVALLLPIYTNADSDTPPVNCQNVEERESSWENQVACAAGESATAAKKMKDTYYKLIEDLKNNGENQGQYAIKVKDAIPKLEKSQALWTETIEVECDLIARSLRQSGTPISEPAYTSCIDEKNEDRIIWLNEVRGEWLY